MKATGIVRRIDARGIITQKPREPHKHWVFADFVQNFSRKQAALGFLVF